MSARVVVSVAARNIQGMSLQTLQDFLNECKTNGILFNTIVRVECISEGELHRDAVLNEVTVTVPITTLELTAPR